MKEKLALLRTLLQERIDSLQRIGGHADVLKSAEDLLRTIKTLETGSCSNVPYISGIISKATALIYGTASTVHVGYGRRINGQSFLKEAV